MWNSRRVSPDREPKRESNNNNHHHSSPPSRRRDPSKDDQGRGNSALKRKAESEYEEASHGRQGGDSSGEKAGDKGEPKHKKKKEKKEKKEKKKKKDKKVSGARGGIILYLVCFVGRRGADAGIGDDLSPLPLCVTCDPAGVYQCAIVEERTNNLAPSPAMF